VINVPFHFALPETQDSPTGFIKFVIVSLIALLVPFDFCIPETRIRFGKPVVFGTPVPKTAIHKNGQLRNVKDNINSHACQLLVDSVTQSLGPKSSSQAQLGGRV
jgi:hypothetical protein